LEDNRGPVAAIVRFFKYNLRLAIVLIFFAALISFALFGNKGILQRMKLESEKETLENQLNTEMKRSAELQKEVEELKSSDKKIEKIAREKYGMTKEGEKIQRIVVDSTK
jgi:cell division protein FtsB